jgi:hypothetical protein
VPHAGEKAARVGRVDGALDDGLTPPTAPRVDRARPVTYAGIASTLGASRQKSAMAALGVRSVFAFSAQGRFAPTVHA